MMSQSRHILKSPLRVIVVEDHQLMLWALCKLINGHRPMMEVVGIAANQFDTLTQHASLAPDVVVMRYELAVMDKRSMLPDCLINRCRTLLLMEEMSEEKLQVALRSGAHGVLTRQSSAEEVIKAIEKTHTGELWFAREATGIALDALRRSREQTAPTPNNFLVLTPREQKVLRAVVDNKIRTNKDMAKQLFISESTLRNHLSSIYQKLGVSNRLDLYVYAHDQGLFPEASGMSA